MSTKRKDVLNSLLTYLNDIEDDEVLSETELESTSACADGIDDLINAVTDDLGVVIDENIHNEDWSGMTVSDLADRIFDNMER